MARVRKLEQGTQTVSVHHSDVDCFYQVVKGDDGESYLHLSTFGSDERQSKPKSSQAIQLTRPIAEELARLIRATFPTDVS